MQKMGLQEFVKEYNSVGKINVLYNYCSFRTPDDDQICLDFASPKIISIRTLFNQLNLDEKIFEEIYDSSGGFARLKEDGPQKLADVLNKEVTFVHLEKDHSLPFSPRILLGDSKTYKPSG